MIEKRKRTLLLALPFIILLIGVILTTVLSIQTYRKIAFEHISSFCEIVLNHSPESEQQLLADLKEYHSLSEKELNGNNYLEKYGYRADEFCKGLPIHTFLFPIVLFITTVIAATIGILVFRRQNRKRIDELTKYLEQVNIGSDGTLIQAQEDDFALLQDELYKTVTSLYQTREAAVAAKKSFAENPELQIKIPAVLG